MTDRPIIFSGPMVRALLNGSKTMTRRVLKLPKKTFSGGPIYERPDMGGWEPTTTGMCFDAPWQPGDRLWVREACVTIGMGHGFDVTHWPHGTCAYLADGKGEWYDRAKAAGAKSRPSIHMPRWASRLTLIVDSVKVERLQEISEEDARAEGIPADYLEHIHGPNGFRDLWNSLHGPDAWAANPWVAAISFRTIHANIDAIKEQP